MGLETRALSSSKLVNPEFLITVKKLGEQLGERALCNPRPPRLVH